MRKDAVVVLTVLALTVIVTVALAALLFANGSGNLQPGMRTVHRAAVLLYNVGRGGGAPNAKHHADRNDRDRDHRAGDTRPSAGAVGQRHPVERTVVAVEPLLVAIVGPTGSGKTALSLRLAERFGGEIVNCDSVAVYREFYIGTAKPSQEERARAPHHLLDIVSPDEYMTAGEYARRAREVLNEIKQRGGMPIVVGGTGLYLRALLEGLFAGPERSDELRGRLRGRAERKGAAHLHRLLQRLDPAAAARVHENDLPKVIRALEVCIGARAPMSELWKQGRDPLTGFRILRLGLNPERNALYTRINERCRRMFEAGLVEETRALMQKYPGAWALSSLGYKQAAQYLRGEIDLKLAIWAAQQSHRNYAKRQLTWFRREPEVRWLNGFGDDAEIQEAAIAGIVVS